MAMQRENYTEGRPAMPISWMMEQVVLLNVVRRLEDKPEVGGIVVGKDGRIGLTMTGGVADEDPRGRSDGAWIVPIELGERD